MFNKDDISSELMEKAKQCKSADELVELANSEGIEMSDEMLDAVSGGDGGWALCSMWSDD